MKAILSIGGWGGSRYFSSSVTSSSARTTFINSVLNYVSIYGLDGIEFDWEYPGTQGEGDNIVSSSDAGNFVLFLEALRTAAPSGLIISAATSLGLWTGLTNANVQSMNSVLNYIGMDHHHCQPIRMNDELDFPLEIMNYDIWGSWSGMVGPNAPLVDSCSSYQDGSATYALNAWSAAGFSTSKMILGVPSYGHSYYVTNANAYDSSGELAQYPAFSGYDEDVQFSGVVDGGWLNEYGTVSEGIDYRFDTCSMTVHIAFNIRPLLCILTMTLNSRICTIHRQLLWFPLMMAHPSVRPSTLR